MQKHNLQNFRVTVTVFTNIQHHSKKKNVTINSNFMRQTNNIKKFANCQNINTKTLIMKKNNQLI